MAASGGQIGNKNAAKNRSWAEAIDKVLKQSEEGKRQKLKLLAEKIVAMALDGDLAAMKEIGNRIDGRALSSVQLSPGTDENGQAREWNINVIRPEDMTDAQLNAELRELLSDNPVLANESDG